MPGLADPEACEAHLRRRAGEAGRVDRNRHAAGGGVDITARIAAQRMQQTWSVPVVVENKTGAALDSTEGNHAKLYQGILAQYT